MSTYTQDAAIIELLKIETGKQIGLVVVPDDHPTVPYAIVSPFGGPMPTGDFGNRLANRDRRYAVRCVGEDIRQVEWMMDRVEEALINSHEILGAQWVLPESSGAIVPDGADLYSVVGTFTVRM